MKKKMEYVSFFCQNFEVIYSPNVIIIYDKRNQRKEILFFIFFTLFFNFFILFPYMFHFVI